MRARVGALPLAALGLSLLAMGASCVETGGAGTRTSGRVGTRTNRECEKVPACRAYLQNIRERVYAIWEPSAPLPEGRVVIGMRIDAYGTPIRVDTVRTDSPELARSCRTAVGYAGPFGLIPASFAFLTGNEIQLEFVYRREAASEGEPAP